MNNTDTLAWAIRATDGTLIGSEAVGPALWKRDAEAQELIRRNPETFKGCTVVRVRITTDLGEDGE
jgi:hypothetical protein